MSAPTKTKPSILPGPNRAGIDVQLAIKSLPDSELEAVKAQTSADEFAKETPDEWKKRIVMHRISCAFCHYCGAQDKTPLTYCDKCHCTFFCSEWCKQQDEQHANWCCHPDSVADVGASQIVLGRGMKRTELSKEQLEKAAHLQQVMRQREILSTRWLIVKFQSCGDLLLEEGKYEEALAYYTAATRKPCPTADEQKLTIGSSYGRAKCFFGMELYHLVIAELEVLRRTFHVDISPECVHKRIRCFVKLGMFSEALDDFMTIMDTPLFNNNEFRVVQNLARTPPTKKETRGSYTPCRERLFKVFMGDDTTTNSEYIKAVNNYLQGKDKKSLAVVRESELDGMGVFSCSDVEAGDFIFAELCDAVGSVSINHCETCTKPLNKQKRVPCKGGCGAVFCSEECNTVAIDDFHTWQCNKEIQTNVAEYKQVILTSGQNVMSRMPILLMRLLGKCSRLCNVLEMHPLLRCLNIGQENITLSFEQGMSEFTNILRALSLDVSTFDYYTFDYMRMALTNNTYTLSTENKNVRLPFAVANYKVVSFMNHSCVPNCEVAFSVKHHGNRIFLKARHPIKQGEELLISYFGDEVLDYETRKRILRARYSFTCTCQLCESQRMDKLQNQLLKMTPTQKGEMLQKGKEILRAVRAGDAPESVIEATNALLDERKHASTAD